MSKRERTRVDREKVRLNEMERIGIFVVAAEAQTEVMEKLARISARMSTTWRRHKRRRF